MNRRSSSVEWNPDNSDAPEYERTMTVDLPQDGRGQDQVHLFEERDVLAINMALATRRPLLVLGEPGTGKSQLARAAAKKLGDRPVFRETVNAATEPESLLYEIDLVRRLAESQILPTLYPPEGDETPEQRRDRLRAELDVSKFTRKGVIWKGFEPPGSVVLIDEIDKADPSVPNALLDAFGRGKFAGPDGKEVKCEGELPLVVITSNQDRSLPPAFVRRCLVLRLELPKDEAALVARLAPRAEAHLKADEKSVSGEVPGRDLLEEAARLLYRDREKARELRQPPPGQAEYIDLVWALARLESNDEERSKLLGKLKEFALEKHQAVDAER